MGGKSKSKSSQTTNQNDTTWNFVEGSGDGDRMNLVLDGGSSIGNITQTDHGAIETAEKMSRIAFDAAAEMNRGSTELGTTAVEEAIGAANNFAARSFDAVEDGFDFARDTNRDALDFVERSQYENLAFSREVSDKSLDFARDANADSLDFASTTMAQSIAAFTQDAESSRKQSADQVDRAFALAQMHSRSEGAETMDKTVKVLGWGGALFASVAVLAMFKGK
ncbi:hypothetical protein [Microbulbifer sp. VVAC002]|uniref:hypothetical protein n=1 Tax=Microbulbifer sp. VVAC002 TaxID=3243387 RepID=UPI00403A4182